MSLIAEVLCIGTELLLGDIINTNATYFAQELSAIGINLFHITTVGDNKERIISAIDIALKRADILITTGGLGPTEDDITHDCIAEYLSVEQRFHKEIADRIEFIFKTIRKKDMPKSNLKQAYLPNGALVLPNNNGTAPGIIYKQNKKIILTFPGVPSEMKYMWEETGKPYLISQNSENKIIKSITLRFSGEGESAIAEKVSDFLNNANPTVAPYAGKSEARLRITAKADDEQSALKLIEPVKNEILVRLGQFFYGYEEDSLQSVIIKKLIEKNKTLSILEISTGGILTNRITSIESFEKAILFSSVIANKNSLINIFNLPHDFLNYDTFNDLFLVELAKKVKDFSKTDIVICMDSKMELNLENNKKLGKAIIVLIIDNETIIKNIDYPKNKKEELDYYTSQIALNILKNIL